MSKHISVIGGGSWATAIVKILESTCETIHWWVREQEIIDHFTRFHHNPLYLSVVQLDHTKIKISNNINEVFAASDIVILCVPAAYLADTLNIVDKQLFLKRSFVSAIKGVVPTYHQVVSEFITSEYGVQDSQQALVSGPSHAEEVAAEKLTYLTVASSNDQLATEVASLIESRYIKTTQSHDVMGIEYAAILKNIMALAAGIGIGLGYGDNFQAVLISNALREIQRFLDTVNHNSSDVLNSAYAGDLFVTAYSKFSRNRIFGNMIGHGYSVKAAQLEMNMVAEGYFAVKGINEINQKYQVDMPVTNAVYNILYEGIAPAIEFKILADKLT